MKYELILKYKYISTGSFEQVGRIVVSPEHLKAQEDAYESRAKKNSIINDFVILVNELDDNGEFVRVIR